MGRFFVSFVAPSPVPPVSPGTKTWEIGIKESQYRTIQKNSHEHRLARLQLAKLVCEHPDQIYRGWNRIGTEDCYVYVGSPEVDFRSMRIEVPAPPNSCFLVFVLADGTIDDWVWRQLDEAGNPLDLTEELIWERT